MFKVKFLEDLYSMILLSALVVTFQQVFNFASFHLRNLLLQLVLKLLQDFALSESLTYAADSAHVF